MSMSTDAFVRIMLLLGKLCKERKAGSSSSALLSDSLPVFSDVLALERDASGETCPMMGSP
jgi:hypothetical protein